ncbi:glycosyl transferase [Geitlerinema sp. P-1104]|uniref:glycosyl transferase n=1 Tax=Geitlerinema sp. P-1104 TaxID=2546230 RepID=UPI00147763DF|nr:glycosyl transferase [Geitlerinema sp. P-1104]NMG60741.1 glycosyl transferase [Geitlerinema sp. P-1104]
MSRPVLYFAVTNHGFGHAVRAASVAATIQRLNPEILIAMVTTAPRWLLDSYIPGDYLYRPRALDVGVIQADSLNMDKTTTLEKLRDIQRRHHDIIAGEVNFIKLNRAGLVLADIPPLAAKIAHYAGVPGWMMSNFGWDFIYRPWGGEFVEIADWIGECFRACDRLFRLPLHEPMSAFTNISDVGLTGGTPKYSEAQLRQTFSLTAPREKTILLTFGGLGLQALPYHRLRDFPDWQFLTFDRNAPDLPNLRKILDTAYRPVDVMPLCDRVVSKPGYSTFAEALRLDVPLVSVTREGFAEAQILLDGIQEWGQHQIIPHQDFFAGDWQFLRESPNPPKQATKLPKDGNEAIAQAVVDFFK